MATPPKGIYKLFTNNPVFPVYPHLQTALYDLADKQTRFVLSHVSQHYRHLHLSRWRSKIKLYDLTFDARRPQKVLISREVLVPKEVNILRFKKIQVEATAQDLAAPVRDLVVPVQGIKPKDQSDTFTFYWFEYVSPTGLRRPLADPVAVQGMGSSSPCRSGLLEPQRSQL